MPEVAMCIIPSDPCAGNDAVQTPAALAEREGRVTANFQSHQWHALQGQSAWPSPRASGRVGVFHTRGEDAMYKKRKA